MFDPAFLSVGHAGLAGLMALAALLGLKHGFDADHLAVIDAASRLNRQAGRERAARWSGVRFSIGHGLTILGVALLTQWAGSTLMPEWVESAGSWLSLLCLALFGWMSLRPPARAGVTRSRRGGVVAARVVGSPWGALATGVLFALSVDTLSLAAWFGAQARASESMLLPAALCVSFAAGMIMADGLAGWWVNRLAGGTAARDRLRLIAGRVIGSGALATAGLGLVRRFESSVDDWAQAHALALGSCLLVLTSLILLLARRFSAPARG